MISRRSICDISLTDRGNWLVSEYNSDINKKAARAAFLFIKDVGSSGRTRTYNPPVTLRPMFSHRSGLSHQLSIESCRALLGSYWFGSSTPSLCTFLPTL